MIKITAVILSKNAENLIADCLDSVSFCDEIVVIDDNSSDRTPEIAKMMGAQVFPYVSESFAKKRNLGLKKAKGKWILYIDVDERLSPELARRINEITESKRDIYSAYRIKRQNYYLGNNPWPQIERMPRLFKKAKLETWVGDLHESPQVDGPVLDIEEGVLKHYTHQDLKGMLDKTITWSKVEAELRYKADHPKMSWWRFYRVMVTAFYDSYVKQKGYKVGTAGFIESMYQAFSMFITYARLWELQEKDKKQIEKF
jgi:glycosyltransferase involved in cell wall biosynthesis